MMPVARTPEDLAPLIRATLRAKRLTQTAMAEHLGISQKHVSLVLQGKAGLSMDLLFRMLEYLQLPVVLVPSSKQCDGYH